MKRYHSRLQMVLTISRVESLPEPSEPLGEGQITQ